MIFGKKKNIVEKAVDSGQKLEPGIRELVIGRKTAMALLSFGVGSVMVGNFIWNIRVKGHFALVFS